MKEYRHRNLLALRFYYLLSIMLMANSFFVFQISAQSGIEVIDYYPAPGQFINYAGIGTSEASLSLENSGGGLVCLGAWGGYITLKMQDPVENDPDNPYGVDFVVFGNASADFSEPAIVMVMKDENQNALPDDIWYELAGSDHYFSTTIKDYSVTYQKPETESDGNVFWSDNTGSSAYIMKNAYHSQDYYPGEGFDTEFYADSCSFSGTRIQARLDFTDSYMLRSYPKAFGYADNQLVLNQEESLPDNPYTPEQEGMGGDPMDISWAVNEDGEYVDLDEIDFIRLYTGVQDDVGSLGEISPEIRMVVDIEPAPGTEGEENLLLIEDLPVEILPGEYSLKALFFKLGKPAEIINYQWYVSEGEAEISAEGMLNAYTTGDLEISLVMGEYEATMETLVVDRITHSEELIAKENIKVYPLPFQSSFTVEGNGSMTVCLYDNSGRLIYSQRGEDEIFINPGNIHKGLYILEIEQNDKIQFQKVIKQ